MKICTIEDIEAIDRVLKHPSVYDKISDDGSESKLNFTAVSLLENKIPVIMPNYETVIIYIPHNNCTYDVHITSTPEGRGEQAIRAGEIGIRYAFECIVGCEKLICFVPEIYPNVSSFVIRNNFVKEGKLTKSYKKNGVLYDEFVYGLRR